MADEEQVRILKQGVFDWNEYRKSHRHIKINFRGANLKGQNLEGADFSKADIRGTNFTDANLREANFSDAKCGLQRRRLIFMLIPFLLPAVGFVVVGVKVVLDAGVVGVLGVVVGVVVGVVLDVGEVLDIGNVVVIVGFVVVGVLGVVAEGVLGVILGLGVGKILGDVVRVILNKRFAIAFATTEGTSFRDANLTEANFRGAKLKSTDFRKANLTHTCWYGATMLDFVRFGDTYLKDAQLRQWLIGKGKDKNFDRKDLRNLNLQGAHLADASFIGADLSETNLQDADLSRAKLIETHLNRTNLTGACIEDWHINSQTNFKNVICEYIYLKKDRQERRPSDPNRNFAPGEFAALVQKFIHTVDLVFKEGIDWKAFLSSFQNLRVEYGDQNVSIQAIEKKSDGAFVLRLNVPPEADKAEIECKAKQSYETELKIVEAKHRAKLKSLEADYKDEIISLHKEQSSNMMEIAKLLASRPIIEVKSEPVDTTKNEQDNYMTLPEYYQQRLKDLDDNIKQDLELLKDYQDELRFTTDPRTKARYRREIVRQEESVTRYKKEYGTLQEEWVGTPSPQMQEVGIQLSQMDAKLNILLSGQVAIYEDLLSQLNQTQLVLTQKLQDAVDANKVSEPQMQQMLAVLEERIPLLPPNQAAIAEVIKDAELDVKQKLKVTLPIVPMLVEYEGEFELGSGFNIKSAWELLVAKLRRS